MKRVLLLGVGAAAGWIGHSMLGRGRDAAAVKAEETLRNTLNPEYLGRNAGQAAATALAASARSFAERLREEVPAWRTIPPSSPASPTPRTGGDATPGPVPAEDPARVTIRGTATSTPHPTDVRKQS